MVFVLSYGYFQYELQTYCFHFLIYKEDAEIQLQLREVQFRKKPFQFAVILCKNKDNKLKCFWTIFIKLTESKKKIQTIF